LCVERTVDEALQLGGLELQALHELLVDPAGHGRHVRRIGLQDRIRAGVHAVRYTPQDALAHLQVSAMSLLSIMALGSCCDIRGVRTIN